jgi:hypothetical protein
MHALPSVTFADLLGHRTIRLLVSLLSADAVTAIVVPSRRARKWSPPSRLI